MVRPAGTHPPLVSTAGAIGLLALAALSACDEEGPPREPELPSRPAAASARGSARPEDTIPPHLRELLADAAVTPDAAPASSTVVMLRERKLTLGARRVPGQRIAFGAGRLAQLTDDELVVFDTKDFQRELKAPIADPRRVIGLADGSLLVAGQDQLYRLPPGKQKPETYPRIPVFAESLLFSDRREAERFWVLHGFDPTLYQYQLQGADRGLLKMEGFLKLEGFDHRGFAAMKDGSFVFTAGKRFRRFFPAGRETSFAAPQPDAEVWRLLTTRRIDQIWVTYRDGRIQLVQIGARLRVTRTLELPAEPFEIATNDKHIAIVKLKQASGQRRQWSVVVLDQQGKQLLKKELPADKATAAANWAQTVLRNKGVVLSRRAPLVAVGGPSWLGVWDIKTGERVLAAK